MPKRWDICFVFPYTCAFWKWMYCFRGELLQEKSWLSYAPALRLV